MQSTTEINAARVGQQAFPEKVLRSRIDSVDLLRGIVMVLMALDHTREFFTYVASNPTNPASTTLPYFITRWMTHLCAPTFVFLAGTGAYLQLARGKSKRELSRFLVTRGLWLVFIELFVLHFAWLFNFGLSFEFIQVIWVIGWSMVVLAGLIHLPFKAVVAFGVVLVAGHNALDNFQPAGAAASQIWRVFHGVGFIQIGWPFAISVLVSYCLIPWTGVMALGFSFGRFFDFSEAVRRRWCLLTGSGALALLFGLRALNIYGDQAQWRSFGSPLRTAMSFMNVSKYPPSLLFLLATLGTAILAFPLLERWRSGSFGWLRKALVVYGRVPFFYYVLHVVLIHLLALLTAAAFGLNWRWYVSLPPRGSVILGVPPGYGFSLWVVYGVWIFVVVTLYPMCRWFSELKRRRKDWWLSYL